ncbi:MAG TPA: endolytic transglycosylase MltG [Beijerinckiaceae bacterium]|nr:endolytic transglycosylase MltG [Beijerinckiaceae bacterium]
MFGRLKRTQATPASTPEGVDPTPFRVSPKSPGEAIKPSVAPPPPPRIKRPRGGLLSTMSALLTFAVAIAAVLFLGFVVVEREATSPGPLPDDKVVLIPRNTGTTEIAALLKREGVVEHPFLFEMYALLNRQRGQLKAGEFQFKAHASVTDAINTLIEGKAILHSVTIPEGLTSEQIVQRLRDNDALSGDVMDVPREGTLLPDTYKFERGMTRQQLVNAMQAAQRQALTQVWARRSPDLPIKTPQELVILASIVEKETGRADERSRVAGVFINRLVKRMKLQSDPTIVYGLVGGKGTLGRGILKSEIERPTPYNTYVVDGLPPGPIANPGRAALEAVANPSRTKDVFFVADGTGGHVFAETLEQHARNVARWRQVEKARAVAGETPVDRVEPPPDGRTDAPTAPGAASAFTAGTAAPAGGRSRAFDAVEGTTRDPLLNRSYDLNSPKNVPNLRQ